MHRMRRAHSRSSWRERPATGSSTARSFSRLTARPSWRSEARFGHAAVVLLAQWAGADLAAGAGSPDVDAGDRVAPSELDHDAGRASRDRVRDGAGRRGRRDRARRRGSRRLWDDAVTGEDRCSTSSPTPPTTCDAPTVSPTVPTSWSTARTTPRRTRSRRSRSSWGSHGGLGGWQSHPSRSSRAAGAEKGPIVGVEAMHEALPWLAHRGGAGLKPHAARDSRG